jgi:hypothetical protein
MNPGHAHALPLLFFSLVAPAAFGSVVIGTASATTTCTADGAPVTCNWQRAFLNITGLDTSEGLDITASAASTTQVPNQSTQANVLVDFWASTDGPVRNGFATYAAYIDGDHGGAGSWSGAGSVEGLFTCQPYSHLCVEHSTLVPFTLGTPFEITMNLQAGSSSYWIASGGDGGGSANFGLQLFEADMITPVIIHDPPAPVPEPSYMGIVGIALVLFSTRRAVFSRVP